MVRQVVCVHDLPLAPLPPPVIGPGVSPHGSQYASMERAAKEFASIIRRDARREYYSGRVTVVLRSDGVKAIRVHYAMKPEAPVTGGEYVLKLEETADGRAIGVAVEESFDATEQSNEEVTTGGASDTLTLHRSGEVWFGPWAWTFEHEDRSVTVGTDERHGVGGGVFCGTPIPFPKSLYQDALTIIRAVPEEKLIEFERC